MDGDGDGAKTVTGTGTEIGNADGRGGTRLGREHKRRQERERKQGRQRRLERRHEHEWKRKNDKGRTLPTVGLTAFTRECMYVCMVITYSRVWINRIRLPILLVVS